MPDGATSIEGKEDYPVSQISYNDAVAYCEWAGKALPTEAQWEKAARGPKGTTYPWGDSAPDDTMANFVDSFIEGTTPVTKYEKGQSYYGAFDMAGNLYQWCKDWYAREGKERESKNPTGPASGTECVLKGCSFSGSVYPWGDSEPDDSMANFSDSFIEGTTPVTKYEKGQSYYGAFDMAGNLYQWCKDWYSEGKRDNPKIPQAQIPGQNASSRGDHLAKDGQPALSQQDQRGTRYQQRHLWFPLRKKGGLILKKEGVRDSTT